MVKQALTKMYKAGIKQEKINTGRIKKRQYENGFKAGQKSREKEIVEQS
jgi:ribosomal protein L23